MKRRNARTSFHYARKSKECHQKLPASALSVLVQCVIISAFGNQMLPGTTFLVRCKDNALPRNRKIFR